MTPSPTAADGAVLTTGRAAKLIGCAARTVTKWCDSGELPFWRLPMSTDRRIGAADLAAFLDRHGNPVPAKLRAMVNGDGG